MQLEAAIDLLAPALPEEPGSWIDLGAGDGLFTRALKESLAGDSRIIALDRNAASLERLGLLLSETGHATVETVQADLSDLDGIVADGTLDGAVLANALHFVAAQTNLLRTLRAKLKPSGRIVVVEYDGRPASPWVPYPVPAARLEVISWAAGLAFRGVVADRPSRYGGRIYSAVLTAEPPSGTAR